MLREGRRGWVITYGNLVCEWISTVGCGAVNSTLTGWTLGPEWNFTVRISLYVFRVAEGKAI